MLIKAICLSQNKNDFQSLKEVEGVVFLNIKIPGSTIRLKRSLEPFLNIPLTKNEVLNIKRRIITHYRETGYPVVCVRVPPQNISDGILKIVVLESVVGDVKVIGNKWVSSKTIESYLHLKSGDRIDEERLLVDINFINRNPFRQVDVVYAPGKEVGTTDVELLTKDRFPWSFYVGADDSGMKYTGRERWYAGISWGNFLGLDQVFSYRFTSSYDVHEFRANTFQYTAPLFLNNTLTLFGGFTEAHAKVGPQKENGRSYQASGRYTIPFLLKEKRTNEFVLGFDCKIMNNTIDFENNAPISVSQYADIGQFVLGYALESSLSYWKMKFGLEAFFAPVKLFDHQTREYFDPLRMGANPEYIYGKIDLVNLFRLAKDFSVSLLFSGQYSSANLLPSEQFGLGGYNTVRGYMYRYVNGDNAFLTNLEVRSPPLKFLKGDLQFLLFTDYGMAGNHKRMPNESELWQLWGAGPGMRFVIDPYLRVYVDWGIRLLNEKYNGNITHTKEEVGHWQRLHFGVNLSY